ncbi:flagellar basal body rod protein FlgB [Pseudomonas matsuisoli]|uniref:Flagellar basal body rod protein FlgB n=1 Tax=Pseudomonas matsuisoli TaxID=1515666 RepID=A0A917PIL8_9PSED|nr:flagellar basal body rod protein FlgB [Pseudomonas matsuisoli]GGJ80611.1 flagellar basal body rod protein FlgB [Pseudomonas matsuisoli]
MSISFDSALGIHEKALNFRAQRAEVLGNNLANADTPGYKARDLDFSAVLAQEADKSSGKSGHFALNTTSSKHIALEGAEMNIADPALRFRVATNPSLDQNTVDSQVEQASYAENSMQFQASFTLLNSKFKGLISALRGE